MSWLKSQTPSTFQSVVFQAPWILPAHIAASSWAQLSRLPSTVISDQLALGNFILAFVCADCVCDAKKSLSALVHQFRQANISSLLCQIVQKQLRWSMSSCGLLFSPCPVIPGFFSLSMMLRPKASQSRWEVLEWGKILPNIRLSSVHHPWQDAVWLLLFSQYAKILGSFFRLFWRDASEKKHCSEEPGGFYQGALSPLTCSFCLWAHMLVWCTSQSMILKCFLPQ